MKPITQTQAQEMTNGDLHRLLELADRKDVKILAFSQKNGHLAHVLCDDGNQLVCWTVNFTESTMGFHSGNYGLSARPAFELFTKGKP